MGEHRHQSGSISHTGKSKSAFKQLRASQTASRIIESANQLLNTNRTLSNEAIAEAANVSISSIYRYFENRHALFAEMFRLDADHGFNKISFEIAKLNQENCKMVLSDIIAISVNSVSNHTDARRSTFRNISYEVAQEINIKFNQSLCDKLVEQISLTMNCHPHSVDRNMVMILARMLVSIPRITIVEDAAAKNNSAFFSALGDAASDLLQNIFVRADASHT